MLETVNISERENFEEEEKPSEALSTSLQDSVRKIIKSEGYKTFDVEARAFNTGGGNYMGQCFEVDIKGETEDGAKETNIFIKQIITLSKVETISVPDAYLKEVYVYKDLSKVFESLQEQAGVPHHDRYKLPKAYDETNTEAIILDNLNKKNFKTYNRLDVMPLKYAQLAIQELAKFHGLSFVIENKMPEYFNEKIKTLSHPICYNEDWKKYITNMCTSIGNLYDDNIKAKIDNFLPYFLEKYPKFNSPKTNVKRSLTHIDYRINNVLVREENGEPVEVMPIDYQLIDYGCPIRDFFYFIYTGTDREFRQKHLNDLKDLYFETMSSFLKYFDMDVEAVYPRREFEKIYKEWLDFGLMVVFHLAAFIYSPDDGVDLEDSSLSEIQFCPDQLGKDRIKGAIDEYIQWGYL